MAQGEPTRLLAEHGEATLEDLFVRLVGGEAREELREYLDALGR